MNLKQSLIDLAVREAKKSVHKHRLGCVIFDKKRLLSSNYNQPFNYSRKLHPRFRYWPTSIHAEVATILSAKTDLKGASLLVVRLNKADQLRMAKPCDYCMRYIEFVGIKRVWYSINHYPYFDTMSI